MFGCLYECQCNVVLRDKFNLVTYQNLSGGKQISVKPSSPKLWSWQKVESPKKCRYFTDLISLKKHNLPNFDCRGFKIATTLKNNLFAAIFINGSTIILGFPAKLSEILDVITYDMCSGHGDKLSAWIWHFPMV